MKLRFYIIIWTVISAICFIYAFSFRNLIDFETDIDSMLGKSFVIQSGDLWWESQKKSGNNFELADCETMIAESDLVAIITATNERILASQCVKTKIMIDYIFKGDCLEKEVFIYEPVNLYYHNSPGNTPQNFVLYDSPGYVLMQPDEQYLLFLKNDSSLECYTISNVIFGKYAIKFSDDAPFECPVPFSNVQAHDILAASHDLAGKYQLWKDHVLSKYLN